MAVDTVGLHATMLNHTRPLFPMFESMRTSSSLLVLETHKEDQRKKEKPSELEGCLVKSDRSSGEGWGQHQVVCLKRETAGVGIRHSPCGAPRSAWRCVVSLLRQVC